jgi:tetraacyldisaccharide 4'-kinase
MPLRDAESSWPLAASKGLESLWQSPTHPLIRVLQPLAGLLQWLARQRARRWRERRQQLPVPVVVVGNLLVGGTGKTPVLIALVQQLQARGWRPGVISRGYGVRIGPRPRLSDKGAAAHQIGDEPALIAASTGVPVAVHPDRPRAAQALLAAHPELDVILSDDGLQHVALWRDVELLVTDERGWGNGHCLPAGPLREPVARALSVDALIGNGLEPQWPGEPHHAHARRFRMNLVARQAIRLIDNASSALTASDWQTLSQQGLLHAMAGIGRPGRFFSLLKRHGIQAYEHYLDDHHAFTAADFQGIPPNARILVTDKDAVKLKVFNDARIWRVPVQATFEPDDLIVWLEQRLHGLTTA